MTYEFFFYFLKGLCLIPTLTQVWPLKKRGGGAEERLVFFALDRYLKVRAKNRVCLSKIVTIKVLFLIPACKQDGSQLACCDLFLVAFIKIFTIVIQPPNSAGLVTRNQFENLLLPSQFLQNVVVSLHNYIQIFFNLILIALMLLSSYSV